MGQLRPSVKVGDVLGGKYRVERILGAGGVGVIAAGVHVDLGHRVAIKLLRADVEQELKDRFLREARAAVRLQSEHVARVVDVGRGDDGTPYFVMELLSGEDLGRVLERSGPMPIETVALYALQACEGLAEAHAAGIVHRDLKPRNLFLTRRVHGEPLVKILDFGIAKVTSKAEDKSSTGTESVFGSPQYMSPEQMRASRDVDARADVWSLGVCLYELLAGVPPFDAPTVPLLCVKVLTEPAPPLRDKRPDVPQELAAVVERCLSKEPAERYEDVAALASALEPFVPSARGASHRVLAVLHAPPRSVPPEAFSHGDAIGDTRTAGSFDTQLDKKPSRTTLFVALASALGVLLVGGVTIAIIASRAPAPAASTPPTVAETTAPLPTSSPIQTADTALPPATTSPTGPATTPKTTATQRTHSTRKPDGGANPSQRF